MNLITRFLALTSNSRSPEIFRKWTAIGMIASAMGRGSYTIISEPDGPIYPNFYIVFVGPPGMGKSIGAGPGRAILRKIPAIHTGPDKITPERLVSNLSKMSKEQGSSVMALFVDELNVLLQRRGDLDLRPLLTGIYNCPDEFLYETESKGEQLFENCCFNILATTQPSWISANFTMDDLGMGFPSRLFFIYCDQPVAPAYFATYPNKEKLLSEIVNALKLIEMFKGPIKWSDEAKACFVSLTQKGIPPAPTAPHLEHYCSRRDLHLTKLSLIMMRAREPKAMQLEKEDIGAAAEAMLEAEKWMPAALSAIGGNQFRVAQTYLLSYIHKQMGGGHNSRFTATELHRLLTANLTPRESKELLESLISQGLCSKSGEENPLMCTYVFQAKRIFDHLQQETEKAEAHVH